MDLRGLGSRALRVAVAALAVAVSGLAASDRWTGIGPGGGLLEAIALDPASPATVYVGGFGAGIYRSLDSAASFSALGPRNERVFSIGVDPRRGTLYAGLQSALVRSRDGGATWEKVARITAPWAPPDVSPELLASQATAVRFDPQNPLRVWLGTYNDVFVSDDAGESFTGVQAPFYGISSLAQSAASPGLLFVGTYGPPYDGIYKSSDGAKTWKKVATTSSTVNAIVCDPRDPAIAWAATDYALWKTSDAGETWVPAGDLLRSGLIADVAIDPADSRRVLVSYGREPLRETRDGGATWTQSELGDDVFVARIAVTANGSLYAATSTGVYQRAAAPAGAWTRASRGLNGTIVECLGVDEKSSTILAGTSFDHVHRSTDGGASWQRIVLPTDSDSVYELAIDPVDSRNVFARSNAGVLRSIDRGATWSISFPSPAAAKGLHMSPADPKTLYFVAGPYFTNESHVYKTVDGGDHWALVADLSFDIENLTGDPRDPRILYAGVSPNGPAAPGTDLAGGMYRSTDGGLTWSASNGNLDPNAPPWFYRITVSASDPAVLFAAALREGLFRSTDGGAHWGWVGGEFAGRQVLSVAVDPRSSARVLAGTTDGVYVSEDGGANWRAAGEGLAGSSWVTDIRFVPGSDLVRISTGGGGVLEREIVASRARPVPPDTRRRRPRPVEVPPR